MSVTVFSNTTRQPSVGSQCSSTNSSAQQQMSSSTSPNKRSSKFMSDHMKVANNGKKIRYPLRSFIWGSFVVCGVVYTTYNIVQNTMKYLSYPTKFEIDVESAQMQFPKITICLNSMHSKERISSLYPIMDNNINSYYGENIEELTQKISNDTMGQLQDIDMLDFYMTTMSKYVILGCDHNMNDCIDSWAISLTEYGLCVVYEKPDNISSPASSLETRTEQPDHDEETDPRSQYEQVVEKRLKSHAKDTQWRRDSFDVVLAYNYSDWTSGYSGTLGGFTAFFTVPESPGELSHVPRAILSDMTSTRVTIRQVHRQELPEPYGDCLETNTQHSDLLNDLLDSPEEQKKTFEHDAYSAKACMYECRMDAVIAMCSCTMPHYMIKSKHNFPPCDFIVHATCVVPLLRTFEPTLAGCGCRKPCFTTEVEVQSIQKATYLWDNDARIQDNITAEMRMTRLTVSLAEQPEEIYIQKPAYDSTQYVSDVGGSAGLILGISAATLLGVIENGVIYMV